MKALARAFRWRRMLEDGRYGSVRELAKAEGVDRSYVGRLLNLTLLAPDVVEAVLDRRQEEGITLEKMLEAVAPHWPDQRPSSTSQVPTASYFRAGVRQEPPRCR